MSNKTQTPEVVAYIAMSLDGFVADKEGGVSWLGGDGSDPDNMGSYPSFYETIDSVILGRTTYEQIINELSPDKWAYQGKQSYVLTSKTLPDQDEIIFTSQNLTGLITEIKSKNGKDIWICGGANIIHQFIQQGLIDRFHISVIPMILGSGTPLFNELNNTLPLKLISTQSYNGITDLVYEVRE